MLRNVNSFLIRLSLSAFFVTLLLPRFHQVHAGTETAGNGDEAERILHDARGSGCNTLSQPSDPNPTVGATGISINADLDWADSSNADSYDVYLGTDPTPDPGEFKGNTATSNWALPPLSYDTHYYWRVLARADCGNTLWGPTWDFTTESEPCQTPGPPAGPNPAEGATDVSVTTDLNWASSGNADSYDVYFGTDPTPGPGDFRGSTSDSNWALPTLHYSTQYYWRIVAKNDCGNSYEGPTWEFTTRSDPCPAIGATGSPNPTNGETGVSVTADLSWASSSNADRYDVYFGTDSTPDAGEWLGNTAGSDWSLPTLDHSTIYYWKIVAKNDCGNSNEGPTWEFTTRGEPCPTVGAPGGPHPLDGATGVSIDTDLDWAISSNADYYDVYFGTDPELDHGDFAGNTAVSDWTPPTLEQSTQYYWKIVAKNDCGDSYEGPTWDFVTQGPSLVLLEPPNLSNLPGPPTFQWAPGSYNWFAFYCVFSYEGFGYLGHTFWLTDAAFAMPENWWNMLDPNQSQYWAVLGVNFTTGQWEVAGFSIFNKIDPQAP